MMRVVFVATKCVLDRRSGAAVEMKTVLETLAAQGVECHAITMTRFDGDQAFPLAALVGEFADEAYKHRFLEAEHRGVHHRLFYTNNTAADALERSEVVRFGQGVAHYLDAIAPDLVITAGQGAVAEALVRLAQEKGSRCLGYVANPSYTDADTLALYDAIVCPTAALAEYYRENLGVTPGVLRNVFAREHFVERPPPPERRRRGWITLVNPSPEKGATLFFELVRLAARQRPDLRFAVVEARTARASWRAAGRDPVELGNLLWLRNRRDMRPVLRRTAVLVFPSLWFEAAGRLPVEAQLSGVPVVASNRGGLPEQLNGGGRLIDPPAPMLDDYLLAPPPEVVQPWLDAVTELVDDAAAYERAVDRALAAARPFHPDVRAPSLADEIAQFARHE